MPRYARIERDRLADALLDAGPDAPTLCEGWTTHDLAAHLVTRERRPDSTPGILVKQLAGWTEHVRRTYRDDHPYPELVEMVRRPAWWSLVSVPGIDEQFNLLEFFVHHEDVRRARPDWQPRELAPDLAARLWRQAGGLARLRLRRFRTPVAVASPGHGRLVVGEGEPPVTLRGEPAELVMFLFGRQRASRVEIDGPAELADKLRRAKSAV
jgi:uncharacterized protein (TIGR03085 family)